MPVDRLGSVPRGTVAELLYSAHPMDEERAARLKAALAANVCPQCGTDLTDRARYGTGRIAEGYFCSLECVAGFYAPEYLSKARETWNRMN